MEVLGIFSITYVGTITHTCQMKIDPTGSVIVSPGSILDIQAPVTSEGLLSIQQRWIEYLVP